MKPAGAAHGEFRRAQGSARAAPVMCERAGRTHEVTMVINHHPPNSKLKGLRPCLAGRSCPPEAGRIARHNVGRMMSAGDERRVATASERRMAKPDRHVVHTALAMNRAATIEVAPGLTSAATTASDRRINGATTSNVGRTVVKQTRVAPTSAVTTGSVVRASAVTMGSDRHISGVTTGSDHHTVVAPAHRADAGRQASAVARRSIHAVDAHPTAAAVARRSIHAHVAVKAPGLPTDAAARGREVARPTQAVAGRAGSEEASAHRRVAALAVRRGLASVTIATVGDAHRPVANVPDEQAAARRAGRAMILTAAQAPIPIAGQAHRGRTRAGGRGRALARTTRTVHGGRRGRVPIVSRVRKRMSEVLR